MVELSDVRRLVAQRDSAEDDRAGDDHAWRLDVRIQFGMNGLVVYASENYPCAVDYAPGFGHTNLHCAEHDVDGDARLVDGHGSIPQVESRRAEYGGCVSAVK